MEDMRIEDIQRNLINMNLNDYDIIYNVRMPLKECDKCGGNAVAEWNGSDSVLCDCLISTDNARKPMLFGVLWGLHALKKEQVYNE